MHEILHVIIHAGKHSLLLLPWLFLTYLLMECLEHYAGERTERAIARAGRVGPLIGSGLGLLPQCGFSASAAGLYSGRVITVGTLIAVFLSTSDEMIPVFLASRVPLRVLLTVLGLKFVIATAVGFLIDFILRKKAKSDAVEDVIRKEDHCSHCRYGIWLGALLHTLQIFIFVFLINLALEAALHWIGTEKLAGVMNSIPVLGQFVSSLVGLIPNCAASVAIATLYAEHVITAGTMLSGLLTGAGVGVLILFRTNKGHLRENLLIITAITLLGVFFGCLLDFTGLATLLGL